MKPRAGEAVGVSGSNSRLSQATTVGKITGASCSAGRVQPNQALLRSQNPCSFAAPQCVLPGCSPVLPRALPRAPSMLPRAPSMLPLKRPCSLSRSKRVISDPKLGVYMYTYIYIRAECGTSLYSLLGLGHFIEGKGKIIGWRGRGIPFFLGMWSLALGSIFSYSLVENAVYVRFGRVLKLYTHAPPRAAIKSSNSKHAPPSRPESPPPTPKSSSPPLPPLPPPLAHTPPSFPSS